VTDEMDDGALLQAWRDGDNEAGRTLLARHFKGLCRFFRSKVDRDVDDLIQSTMLVAVKYADRLRDAESFRAYLFAIARTQLYEHLSGQREQRERIDFGVTSLRELGTSPSVIAAQRRESAMLVDALRELPADQQIALELHYWEDLTYAEIAEVLGVHRDTIKRRLARGREALRTRLCALSPHAELGDAELDRMTQTAAEDLAASQTTEG
jgi:RNA polymerase sigma-70 factor (ECF subfamily)